MDPAYVLNLRSTVKPIGLLSISSDLMVGQDALVLEAVDVAVDLPLQVRHAPAPVDQEKPDRQNDL